MENESHSADLMVNNHGRRMRSILHSIEKTLILMHIEIMLSVSVQTLLT